LGATLFEIPGGHYEAVLYYETTRQITGSKNKCKVPHTDRSGWAWKKK